jgi:hypothetical protein
MGGLLFVSDFVEAEVKSEFPDIRCGERCGVPLIIFPIRRG